MKSRTKRAILFVVGLGCLLMLVFPTAFIKKKILPGPVPEEEIPYTDGDAERDFLESCLPICTDPRRSDLVPSCECWCRAKAANLRALHPKSKEELDALVRAKEGGLSIEQGQKCFSVSR